jgi:hypothetical protein
MISLVPLLKEPASVLTFLTPIPDALLACDSSYLSPELHNALFVFVSS